MTKSEPIRVEITRRMRSRGIRVGTERQEFHDAKGTPNSYGLKGDANHWLKINIQGAMAELVVATHLGVQDRWVECVENYQTLKGDVIDHLQVRSTYNPGNGLILHHRDKDEDCFVLVLLDQSHEFAILQGWMWAADGKLEKYWPGKHPDRPCFTVPVRSLHQGELPVWEGAVVRPRSNADRIDRKRKRTTGAKRTLDDTFKLTCPRCGWAAKRLTLPYHPSKFAAFGGICSECCYEAATRYDAVGWPEQEADGEPLLTEANEDRLVGMIFDIPGVKVKRLPKASTINKGQGILDGTNGRQT